MKFSRSACRPLKVTGFSTFTLFGCKVGPVNYYYGYYYYYGGCCGCYYWEPVASTIGWLVSCNIVLLCSLYIALQVVGVEIVLLYYAKYSLSKF